MGGGIIMTALFHYNSHKKQSLLDANIEALTAIESITIQCEMIPPYRCVAYCNYCNAEWEVAWAIGGKGYNAQGPCICGGNSFRYYE